MQLQEFCGGVPSFLAQFYDLLPIVSEVLSSMVDIALTPAERGELKLVCSLKSFLNSIIEGEFLASWSEHKEMWENLGHELKSQCATAEDKGKAIHRVVSMIDYITGCPQYVNRIVSLRFILTI